MVKKILKSIGAKQPSMLMDGKKTSPHTTIGKAIQPIQRKAVIGLFIDQPAAWRNSNHFGKVQKKMKQLGYTPPTNLEVKGI
jgi:hypothetical protein